MNQLLRMSVLESELDASRPFPLIYSPTLVTLEYLLKTEIFVAF